MTGYARKFDQHVTMSFRVNNNNKQLLKNYNRIWEKIEKLMSIDFKSKPVYGDGYKYIKKNMQAVWLQIFITKKYPKKQYYANVYQ